MRVLRLIVLIFILMSFVFTDCSGDMFFFGCLLIMAIYYFALFFKRGKEHLTLYLDIAAENDKMHVELKELNESLERKIEEHTEELRCSCEKIRNLLNNAGQGFLTFGVDLLIDNIYNSECIKILNGEIENRKLSELFYDDVEQAGFFDKLLRKILVEEKSIKVELYIPLLPSEIILDGKFINVEYKIVKGDDGEKHFMVILTDITKKKDLQNKMDKEKQKLNMVVKVVAGFDYFNHCVEDYREFCSKKIDHLLESGEPPEKICFEIFRIVHTFKGNFSQFYMTHMVDQLHMLESCLQNKRNSIIDANGMEQFKAFIKAFDMEKWLDDDFKVLERYLGKEFLNRKDIIGIEKSKLIELETNIEKVLPVEESELIMAKFKRLRYKSMKDLLKLYPEYVSDLARKLEKPVYDFKIEGDEISVDADYYYGFVKSLIHVFRNMVDHGMENIDERILAGKDEKGSICCTVAGTVDGIEIRISDDGRGISIDELHITAVNKGVYTEDEIQKMTAEEIINTIFRDGFSTGRSVNCISGMGMGLSAVKAQLDKIGGIVRVHSKYGHGTEFVFVLPFVT